MTPDEQEALSRRHDRAARIILLPLSSGAVAIFNGELDLCGYVLPPDEWSTLPANALWDEIQFKWHPPAPKAMRPQPTLEDLGL
jgi:hypothetical protein